MRRIKVRIAVIPIFFFMVLMLPSIAFPTSLYQPTLYYHKAEAGIASKLGRDCLSSRYIYWNRSSERFYKFIR